MIPARFDYEVADSVEHAVELLGSKEEAKLLAGGHSLIPLMRLRVARPGTLVDIGRLQELVYVRDAGAQIAIGALTRYHDVEHDPLLQEHCPLVPATAGEIGDPQVRHRATIGGAVAYGDPASDMPTVLLALDAELVVRGPEGERVVGAGEFFRGAFETALGPQDVLTEVRVPKLGADTGWAYLKFRRRAQDWATVGVAALVRRQNGTIGDAAIALTSMGPTPLRARAAEEALRGAGPDGVGRAAEAVVEGTKPSSDVAASADFRRHLATVLCRRAVEEALRR
jgi:aerobic carbon-monoxide dehydrogenase medium subunit